ncbi:MAG: histidine phosphatase family protein [Meiothermus sp.]|nr:histidine phosphatase family protein [Meiothermus sp.]
MIELTLLRHGRSAANDEKVHEGRYDSPLTAVGLEQARKRLADFRAGGLRFDRIIASPLARARAVAEVMSEGLGVPPELDPDWIEMDNGAAAGLTWEAAQERSTRLEYLPDKHGWVLLEHQMGHNTHE